MEWSGMAARRFRALPATLQPAVQISTFLAEDRRFERVEDPDHAGETVVRMGRTPSNPGHQPDRLA